jgi:uncharacterized membrane-anchored protein
MNSERTLAAGASARPATPNPGFEARALDPSPAFWFAMFAASALGTVLGDFWAEGLRLGLVLSFGSLIVISAVLIFGDMRMGRKIEAFYWLAIVVLRAAATNVGDGLIHILGLTLVVASLISGVATLAAGYFTIPPSAAAPSPRIDLRYWGAMFLGGVFGTVAGDLAAHSFGMFPALVVLAVALVAIIVARSSVAPTAMVGYWCIVLAERAAGTPAGDWFASRRGLGLGLPIALACTGAVLLMALLMYSRTKRAD